MLPDTTYGGLSQSILQLWGTSQASPKLGKAQVGSVVRWFWKPSWDDGDRSDFAEFWIHGWTTPINHWIPGKWCDSCQWSGVVSSTRWKDEKTIVCAQARKVSALVAHWVTLEEWFKVGRGIGFHGIKCIKHVQVVWSIHWCSSTSSAENDLSQMFQDQTGFMAVFLLENICWIWALLAMEYVLLTSDPMMGKLYLNLCPALGIPKIYHFTGRNQHFSILAAPCPQKSSVTFEMSHLGRCFERCPGSRHLGFSEDNRPIGYITTFVSSQLVPELNTFQDWLCIKFSDLKPICCLGPQLTLIQTRPSSLEAAWDILLGWRQAQWRCSAQSDAVGSFKKWRKTMGKPWQNHGPTDEVTGFSNDEGSFRACQVDGWNDGWFHVVIGIIPNVFELGTSSKPCVLGRGFLEENRCGDLNVHGAKQRLASQCPHVITLQFEKLGTFENVHAGIQTQTGFAKKINSLFLKYPNFINLDPSRETQQAIAMVLILVADFGRVIPPKD